MRLAILSDIHSNLEALTATLAHAQRQGVDGHVFLGDLVGYGADPVACLKIIAGMTERGAIAVRGNHDVAALGGLCEQMNFAARDVIYWTRKQLGAAERAWLEGLPLLARQGDALFVHASAHQPELWPYITGARDAERCIEAANGRVTFVGHVHHTLLYYTVNEGLPRAFIPTPGVAIPTSDARRWLAIVGSVGQPRDGLKAAAYAIMDDEGGRTLTFFRVPYDYESAARKVRAAGLPERLALRLEHAE